MIPLIFKEQNLKDLAAYAEGHKITAAEMVLIGQGRLPVVGDREHHALDMDVGYRVVYSIEEHPQPDGNTQWLRHMSMSQARKGREPSPTVMEMVSKTLGFPPLEECLIQYNETDGQPEVLSIYNP